MKRHYLCILLCLFYLAGPTYCQMTEQLNQGLIGFWRMDETSGSTVYDFKGTNHCTVQTGVTLNQNGLINKSVSFISNSGGLTTGKKASQLGIGGGVSKSISIWIKPDPSINGINSPGIIDMGNHANQRQFGIKYYGAPAFWMFDSWYGSVRIGADNDNLADGQWHHIVVTYDQYSHTVKTYLDGDFITEDNTKILNTGDDNGFSIGIGSQGKFPGLIDEVGLWSRTLNDIEVASLFNYGQGLTYPFLFLCGSQLHDTRNGKIYPTVNIGNTCWMAENLDLGTKIQGSQNQTNNNIWEKYCYNNLDSNCEIYGGLYQWNEMMQYLTTAGGQGICPEGWHVPEESDFLNLISLLGGEEVSGGKLKEDGFSHWAQPNISASNSSGFTAIPGGYRDVFGNYAGQGFYSHFWTGSSSCNVSAKNFQLVNNQSALQHDDHGFFNAFSVRCVYDTCVGIASASLQIESSDTNICSGMEITLTALPTYGGYSPAFQWYVNGTPQSGATNLTYTYEPSGQDTVWCQMVSAAKCVGNSVVISDTVIIHYAPELEVAATETDPSCLGICDGTISLMVTGGTPPFFYVWNSGDTTQTEDSLCSGNYMVTVTDAAGCNQTRSYSLEANNSPVTANITIYASQNPFCPGTLVQYSVAIENGGSEPGFQWQVNGEDVADATQPVFEYAPANGDMVRCKLTSSEPCTFVNPVFSNEIIMESYTVIMDPVGPITGPSVFCKDAPYPAVMWEYSIDPIPGVVNYYWLITRNGIVEETYITQEPMILRGTPTSTYMLTVGNFYYCGITSIYSSELQINVFEVSPVIEGPDTVTMSDTCTYTTQPGMTDYQWFVSPGGHVIGGGSITEDFILIRWDTSGYQTVSVNYKDANNCTANQPTVDSILVNLPTLTLANIGGTRFDVQTNASGQNRLYLYPDGTLGATYILGYQDAASFPDRGTGYNYFNGTNWNPPPVARIENKRTGWPSYSAFGANGELVVTHTNDSPTKLMLATRTTKGAGAWNFSELSWPNATAGLLYPRAVTNGSNHTNIHLLALTTPGTYGGYIVYNRSMDGGLSWSGWQIIPGLDSAQYSGFSADAFSFAQPIGDTLCFTSGTNWCDQVLMKSTDNGSTWTKTIIWPSLYNQVTSQVPADTFYCADKSNAIVLDNEGKAHVVFGRARIKANGSIASAGLSDGLIYWNENMPQLPQSLDSSLLVDGGNWLANISDPATPTLPGSIPTYGLSLTSMPAMVADNDTIYVAWSSATSVLDTTGKKFHHVFAKASNNKGESWCSNTIDLSAIHGFSRRECVYPSFAPQAGTNDLYLLFQHDSLAGSRANSSGQSVYDNNQLKLITIAKSSFSFGSPPEQPGPISGPTSSCTGTEQGYSIPNQPGVSYQWTFPQGWIQTSGGTTHAVNVLVGPSSGLIQVVPSNGCGNGPARIMSANPLSHPGPAGPISGPALFCNMLHTMEMKEYSIEPIPGATSYEWFIDGVLSPYSNSNVIFLPFPQSSYLLSVRGVNGCGYGLSSELQIILITIAPVIQGSNLVCAGSTESYFTELGMSNYQWTLSGGGNVISGGGSSDNFIVIQWTENGDHDITVNYKGNHGCSAMYPTSYQVTVQPQIILDPMATIEDPSCFDGCDGSITDILIFAGSPPFSYLWSNGMTTLSIYGLCAGFYSLTVTDAHGCEAIGSWTIGSPEPLSSYNNFIPVSCAGSCDASVSINTSGGTPPYSYLWNDGSFSPVRTGLCAGTYSVTITDNNNCQLVDSFLIDEPEEIAVSASFVNASCTDTCDGIVTLLDVTGGTPPYSYLWSNGNTASEITGLCEGGYTLTVTDSHNCQKSLTFNIFAASPVPVSVSMVASANPVPTGTLVTCTATPVNGGASPVFQWFVNGISLGSNSPSFSFYPAQNDVVTCTMNSSEACVTGNPATSNAISMNVTWTVCPGIPTVNYEGKTYNTVQIGNQCWFRENLNAGTLINGNLDQTNNDQTEKYCYNNLESNCDIYGGLYQWGEAMSYTTSSASNPNMRQGICPTGWHIPSETEWCEMASLLDPTVNCATIHWIGTDAGGKMKEPGLSHWATPNQGATDFSGLKTIATGHRAPGTAVFADSSHSVSYWTSTELASAITKGWYYFLDYNSAKIWRYYLQKTYGHSVRCVKDTCPTYSNVSVTIGCSSNPVANGTLVTFIATPVNPGSSPQYQWKVNGTAMGTNSPSFSYYPVQGDQVMCVLNSNQSCISGNPANSNIVTMQVTWPTCPDIPTVIYHDKTYNTVLIGSQCWLRENLNIGQKINGTINQSDNETIEKHCFNDLEANCDVYGGLYQWNEMMNYQSSSNSNPSNRRGICPSGWHIPSENEWCQMEQFLDSSVQCSAIGLFGQNIGGQLKQEGITLWSQPNLGATNLSNFSALPGGCNAGGFIQLHDYAYFWTSLEYSSTRSWMRYLGYALEQGYKHYDYPKSYSFSVRCVKDEELPTNQSNLNQVIPSGQTHCYNATQTITVAGNGSTFIVEDGGSATMIAGQNILYNPGTSVLNGGYMHGYIAPGGPWCMAPAMPAVIEGTPDADLPGAEIFRVYPNPTSARFTLELAKDPAGNPVRVEIFNLLGKALLKEEFTTGRLRQYSLGDEQPGIYMVRVTQGGVTGSIKVIRQ